MATPIRAPQGMSLSAFAEALDEFAQAIGPEWVFASADAAVPQDRDQRRRTRRPRGLSGQAR